MTAEGAQAGDKVIMQMLSHKPGGEMELQYYGTKACNLQCCTRKRVHALRCIGEPSGKPARHDRSGSARARPPSRLFTELKRAIDARELETDSVAQRAEACICAPLVPLELVVPLAERLNLRI